MTKSIPALLRAHDFRPRKDLSQNFLTDPNALERIVAAADLQPDDAVVEVGAGFGNLTRLLAERAGRVVAVELDGLLVEILREQLAALPERSQRIVQVMHGNVLEMVDLEFPHRGFKVVGNLPYHVTSAVLRHFLEQEPRPRLMVVTVQREVAQRIVAKPGKMSLLAVSVQLHGEPSIVARIPAGAFYPPPKVDSAVVRIEVGDRPSVLEAADLDDAAYFRVVRAGFGQKRKTLRNSLSAGLGMAPAAVERALASAAVDPRRRAETLSLEEWAEVTSAVRRLEHGEH